MQLSKRLQAVANLIKRDGIEERKIVADIGCDHAYISIYLICNQIADYCIAMDIHSGPLERAKENIKIMGVEKKVDIRLSDGAKKLKEGEVNSICIAGMGGRLIRKILLESRPVIIQCQEWILQPQSEQELVRKTVHELGFQIIQEDMIEEDKKYYMMFRAVPGRESYQKEVYYLFGKQLLEQKNSCLKEYLQYGYQIYSQILHSLEENHTKQTEQRKEELQVKLSYIVEGLKYYEM